jgi:hypothetical protein
MIFFMACIFLSLNKIKRVGERGPKRILEGVGPKAHDHRSALGQRGLQTENYLIGTQHEHRGRK